MQKQFQVDLHRHRGYECRMLRFFRQTAALTLLTFLLLATPANGRSAQDEQVSATRPAEYMIYQYPDIALVVKVDAPETEFVSQISGPDNAVLREHGVVYRRIGPIFQYIDPADTPRQLMIKLTPERKIDRSRIGMELIQLSGTERNSKALAQAYQLFSTGTQRTYASDTTTWAMKIYSLRSAARAFAELGMEEMSLWSEFYAAHLILYQLSDELTALEMTHVIQRASNRAGFDDLELAALVLESDALLQAAGSAGGRQAQARYREVHEVLDRLAKLANRLQYQSEHARALYQDGIAYEAQGDPARAIERYRMALEIGASAGNPELVNQIRSAAALAYEILGSTSGAIEMLEDIAGELANQQDGEAAQELAENQAEKGRLLNRSYRYREAAAVLSQALHLMKTSQAARPWGATGLALAWSQYSLGYFDQATALIEESLPRTPQSGNSTLLTRAFGNLADYHRSREQFGPMETYRERQGSLIGSGPQRAFHLYEKGIDAWRREGSDSVEAIRLLRQSRQAGQSSGDRVTEHRASLSLCSLRLERRDRQACSASEARASFRSLESSGIPWVAADAALTFSVILRRLGKIEEARGRMNLLIDDIHFLRQQLPGILGAWYWENKPVLYREYLSITLAESGAEIGQVADGEPVMLALDRIRTLENAESPVTADGQHEALRALLAEREEAEAADISSLAEQADEELKALRKNSALAGGAMNDDALRRLLAGLGSDEMVLGYYFSESAVYALPGDRKGIRLFKLPNPRKIRTSLNALRSRFGRAADASLLSDLDTLGTLMLDPVASQLAETVYLLPSGPLNGIPFDALRLNGRFLAENHRLLNLLSLSALARGAPKMQTPYRDRIFLAGSPQAGQELFSYGVSSTAEIGTVRDEFVGPGLHIVQGVALKRDEFFDDRFNQAALIHLAIPGSVDLARPERSRLMLSGTQENPSEEFLAPADVRAFDLSASLVILSGTAFVGRSETAFDGHLGFISDFHDAGAGSVIAAIWPAGDHETAAFMSDFYRRLESGQDIAGALFRSRQSRISPNNVTNFASWAGFQLFIR